MTFAAFDHVQLDFVPGVFAEHSRDSRHEHLLASYLLNLEKGEWFVFQMMAADIRGFVDLGALELAIEERPRLSAYARQGRLGRLTWERDEFS